MFFLKKHIFPYVDYVKIWRKKSPNCLRIKFSKLYFDSKYQPQKLFVYKILKPQLKILKY